MFFVLLLLFTIIFVGHFVYGFRQYIPYLLKNTDIIDEQSKAIFGYISSIYILIFFLLISKLMGLNILSPEIFKFLGIWFLMCSAINFYYAKKVGILKIFQWILFLIIGILFLIN